MILIPENESDVKSSVGREVELEADRSFSEQEQQLPEHTGYRPNHPIISGEVTKENIPQSTPKVSIIGVFVPNDSSHDATTGHSN